MKDSIMYDHLSIKNNRVLAVRRDNESWHDDYIENIAPMIFKHGGTQKSSTVSDMLEDVHSSTYVENRRALGKAFGWTEGDWIELIGEQVGYDHPDLGDLLMDEVTDALAYEDKNIELFEEIATTLGIICVRITGRGYCQGDYIEALAFANKAYIKEKWGTDIPDEKTIIESLKQDGETYTAWAFGDVYDVQIHELPEDFDHARLDEEDLEELLDEADPDWNINPIDGITLIEQMPDFDTHPDVHNLVYPTERLCA